MNIRVKNTPCITMGNMKKLIVSLNDETDEMLRRYAKETYHNRRGALSIVVESAILEYLKNNGVKIP